MKNWFPELWAHWTQGGWRGVPPTRIEGLVLDSRKLRDGDGFVAIRTEVRDGHDFLAVARDNGAAFALVELGRSLEGLPCLEVLDTRQALTAIGREIRNLFKGVVIGISGSCGKTSTKEMLSLLLGERTCKTPGNLNNDLGLPLSLLSLCNEDHDYGVFELGINHPGEMQALAEVLRPDYAVITSVAPAHLEGMGNVETVAWEKSLLLRALKNTERAYFPASCSRHEAFATIAGQQLAEQQEVVPDSTKARVRRYRTECKRGKTGLWLEPCSATRFDLHSAGSGMASNAALALSLALDLGIQAADAAYRLDQWRPSGMRAEWKWHKRYPVFVDCYNSNPASLQEAVDIFQRHTSQYLSRLWVIGGMRELGEESAYWHESIALNLPLLKGDTVIGVGEEALAYEAGIRANGVDARWIHVEHAEEGRAWVEAFEGPLFFKGSRGFALEKMLPVDLVTWNMENMEFVC